MTTENNNNKLPAIVDDGFNDSDPSASPLKGTGFKFTDGDYFSYGDQLDVEGKSFAVLGRARGWQKLQKDCPPEYLMRQPGQPMPPQPHVDKADWPLNFNKVPEHPWKQAHYLYLVDTATGEFSTFWTNTAGGNHAIGELKDQIELMRQVRPNAMPIVALLSKDMPTQYGSSKPRPWFKILGWKSRGDEQGLLAAPEQKLVDVEKPSIEEVLKDELPPWATKGDELPDLGKRNFGNADPKKKKK
jgi:hypothetical protein